MLNCRVVQRIISEADDLNIERFDQEVRLHIGSCERCSRYFREMASVNAAFLGFIVPGDRITLESVVTRCAMSEYRRKLGKATAFLLLALFVLAWSFYANSKRVDWLPYGLGDDPATRVCAGQNVPLR